MKFSIFLIIALALLAFAAEAAIDRTTIQGKLAFPNVQPVMPPLGNIKISLNGHEFTTLTSADGSFSFYDVPVGIYSLDVLSTNVLFPSSKLKITRGNIINNDPDSITNNQNQDNNNNNNNNISSGKSDINEPNFLKAF